MSPGVCLRSHSSSSTALGMSRHVGPRLFRCGTTTILRRVGSPSAICGHALEHVEVAPGIAVAVGDEQDLRLDLAEAVEHAAYAEIRRARRPDDALRQRGEREHPGLGHVRDKGRGAIARAQAQLRERLRGARHVAGEVGVAHAALEAALVPEHERVALVAAPEQVLGEIQARVRKPLGAWHLVAVHQHRAALFRSDHAAPVPDLRPELLGMVHRPLVELGVGIQLELVLAHDMASELRDLRVLDRLLGGCPDGGTIAADP